MGMWFSWGTDWYGLKFILLYDGTNPVILCLQMRLMCWDMDIIHLNDNFLIIDIAYWSCLGSDLCFDPLLRDYTNRAVSIRANNPVPETLPMLAENIPGARGPHLPHTVDTNNAATVNTIDVHAQSLFSSIHVDVSNGHKFLTHVSLQYKTFTNRVPLEKTTATPLSNSNLPAAAKVITRCDWVVYSFSNEHFVSSIAARNFPFHVTLAANPFTEGTSFIWQTHWMQEDIQWHQRIIRPCPLIWWLFHPEQVYDSFPSPPARQFDA